MFFLQYFDYQHWKDPLYRTTFFIIISSVVDAGFGFIFWMLAAKLYPKEDLGIAIALISSMALLVAISGLGFDQSIIRFFPEKDKSKVFSTSVIVTTFFSFLFGIIFIIGTDLWSPDLSILKSNLAILYLIILAAYSVSFLIASSFIAMRKTELYFFQNIIYGSKIVFLFPLIFLGAMGIFGAFGASLILACIVCVFLLVKLGVVPEFTLDKKFLRDTFHFSAGNYFSRLLTTAPALVLPIMVLNVLGAEETAIYYIVYSITAFLFVIPNAVCTSLFVEGSHGETLKKNTLKSMLIIIFLLIPAAIVLYLFGGFILGIIGKSYVEGLNLLRLLAISSFFVAVVNIYFTIKKVQKDMKGLVLLSALLFVLLIGLSYVFIREFGIVGVGYAWMIGYGLSSIIVGLLVSRERWI